VAVPGGTNPLDPSLRLEKRREEDVYLNSRTQIGMDDDRMVFDCRRWMEAGNRRCSISTDAPAISAISTAI
jgi:hypothetical protein